MPDTDFKQRKKFYSLYEVYYVNGAGGRLDINQSNYGDTI